MLRSLAGMAYRLLENLREFRRDKMLDDTLISARDRRR